MNSTELIISLLMGVCVGGIAFTNRSNYAQFVSFIVKDLDGRLRSLRIKSPNLRRWINLWLGCVVALFLAVWLGADAFVPGFMSAVLLLAGPWYLVRRLSEKRRQKIEDQLADSMVMFSSGVRAGLSLAQALELLSIDCPFPINQEFRQIVGEYKMGKPLERTLSEAKERLKSENFILFSAALLASRESGGRLNETVERISKSVVEIQRLERKVQSETAQARKSALYMMLVTPIILLANWFLSPESVQNLFELTIGQIIICVVVLLNIIAYLWALKILKPDI